MLYRALAFLIVLCGLLLMATNIIGIRASQQLPGPHTFEELYQEVADSLPPNANAEQTGATIIDTLRGNFTNALESHTIYSNWILYLLGSLVNENFLVPRDPDVVMRTTRVLQCGGFSYLGMRLALRSGLIARQVGLNGHVVFEIFYGSDWHMFDPSNAVYTDSEGKTYSVSYLEDHPETLEDIYRTKGEEGVASVKRIFTSKQDNTFMTIPAGIWFNPKGEIFMAFERVTEVLKWVIPAALIFLGTFLLRPSRQRSWRTAV